MVASTNGFRFTMRKGNGDARRSRSESPAESWEFRSCSSSIMRLYWCYVGLPAVGVLNPYRGAVLIIIRPHSDALAFPPS